MKNVKVMLTAVAAVMVVSGALAFKNFSQKNLLWCNPTTKICELPATAYSTIAGTPTTYPSFTLYDKTQNLPGASCLSTPCKGAIPTTTQIFTNL